MKNVSNIIAWTSVDEQIHANAGIYIINKIKEEFPDYFDAATVEEINQIVQESIAIESEILDWIFEFGELETISKNNLLNFMKFRLDESLVKIGMKKIFFVSDRSEERRVGKECRSRWSTYH